MRWIAGAAIAAAVLAAAPAPATADTNLASPPAAGDASAVGPPQATAPTTAFDWHLPRGFPTPAVPADNPMSAAKVALGRRLFSDPTLSITGQYSCASCHDPAKAYSDGLAHAVGATGQPLSHSAMPLINVAYNISYGWTKPELQSLEAQMLQPLLNQHPVELGLAGREASVVDLLASEPTYRAAFTESFPTDATPVTFQNVVKAIAAFERTLIYGNSPFDRYVFNGEHDALAAPAKRGMQLFYSSRTGCGTCHSGFNFAGNWRDSQGDTGKPSFANNGVSDQPMRVPTLRNVAVTAPYMHDGRFATLDAVLDHYTKVRLLDLTADERADLLAFLDSLTDAAQAGR